MVPPHEAEAASTPPLGSHRGRRSRLRPRPGRPRRHLLRRPGDMVPVLATKETAKDAWEAIKTLRIGDDRVWIATAQNLRAEYEGLAL